MSMKLAMALCLALLVANVSEVFGADWPQWRGPERTDISSETGLLKTWPEGGPERVWLFDDAGIGYSGFAVVNGTLFTMGARDGTALLLALDARTGEEKWSAAIGPMLANGWGDGPRGTPTVDGDRVYALSGRGHLVCVKAADGKPVWKVTLKDLGGKTPGWGYAESVLVDGDKLVCTPGGKKGAVAALDKMTGEVIWRSKEFTDGAQYSSLIPFEHRGKRQYAQLTMESIAGIAAEDGELLWRSSWPGRTAVIPTPIVHSGSIYVTSGYGVGCKMVSLGEDNEAEEVYANKVMKNHHGGVIKLGDHLYGYSDGAGWVCQEFATGEMVWNEKEALGKGAVAYADGMLYCLSESDGTVVLVEASPEGWKEHGRFKLDPQTKLRKPRGRIWTHPVISNGRLYLRDQDLIYCYDVRARPKTS